MHCLFTKGTSALQLRKCLGDSQEIMNLQSPSTSVVIGGNDWGKNGGKSPTQQKNFLDPVGPSQIFGPGQTSKWSQFN